MNYWTALGIALGFIFLMVAIAWVGTEHPEFLAIGAVLLMVFYVMPNIVMWLANLS